MDELDKPVLTEQGLFEFLCYEEELTSITRHTVKWAVINREIIPTRIGRRNFFSKRDGLDWVASLKLKSADQTAQAV